MDIGKDGWHNELFNERFESQRDFFLGLLARKHLALLMCEALLAILTMLVCALCSVSLM